jgi:uncharacterized pyridoxamine 5'-phosphate oxidase family protein
MTRDEAIQFIERAHFGYVATHDLDSGVSVRPVAIDTIYGRDLFFFTFATTPKVRQIAANPHVSVVWADVSALTQVRVKGTAYVEEDPAVITRFKDDNPMVDTMLPPGTEGLFVLFRVQPELVQAAQGLVPYETVDW